MTRNGYDETEKFIRRGHILIAVHELSVQSILTHAHIGTGIVFLIAESQMNAAAIIDIALTAMEGVGAVSCIGEQACKGIRIGVTGVHRGGSTGFGGEQSGVYHEFCVKSTCCYIGGSIVIFENYAFLLYSVEIGHILLAELPCIDSLKLYEYNILALKNAAHIILFVLIPTLNIVVN